MLLLISFAAILAIYFVSRIYAQDDNRLPPASTQKGKQARFILGGLLLLSIVLIVLNYFNMDIGGNAWMAWVLFSLLAISLPIFKFIRFKNSSKKK